MPYTYVPLIIENTTQMALFNITATSDSNDIYRSVFYDQDVCRYCRM
jgi:hypothetical protein